MPRVLIIGLDGATWRVLAPLADSGRMPRLRDLMASGAWGPLRSTIPALTMPSWSSFVTGKNPGGHGVFAFTRTDPHGYVPAARRERRHAARARSGPHRPGGRRWGR
jgi:predicted AlkP superfamily phosphohydrolase/phosphomutase